MTTDNKYTFEAPVRAAFLNVIVASAPKLGNGKMGEPNYNGTFLLPNDSADLKNMKAAMVAVARAKWPNKPLSAIHFPVKSGEVKAAEAAKKGKDGAMYAGHAVLNASSGTDYPPRLSILENGKVVTVERDSAKFADVKSKFYHGCFVAPQLAFVAYDGNGSNIPDSVKAYLQMVLRVKDGPRIGGGDATEVFKGYVGQVTPDFDPTAGVSPNDGIPF
jgi:hypothetical protein